MKRRVLTIALAVLLAVFGTGGVLAYVHQADSRALAGMKAVTVLVAVKKIPAGTPADAARQEGLLSSQRLPASSVPPDALRSIGPALASLVTSADIQPGQLLLRPMLVPAAQVTGALAIPPGMVAVTIALCMPEAVAGDVRPGSQVAVFDTYARGGSLGAQANCQGPHQEQAFGSVHTRIVLPRVLVLSLGAGAFSAPAGGTSATSTAFSGNGSASGAANQNSVLVTMAVSQADAERLIQLTEAGLPYLALLTPSSKTGPDSGLTQLLTP